MDQANAEKDHGKGEGSEGMRKAEQDIPIRELSTASANGNPENSAQGNAIARLNSIPSELEVIYFLHDQGKILFHAGEEFHDWLNILNGVDIAFSDGVALSGCTDQAFIDVKNVKLKYNGQNFPNLLIEVAKWKNGSWSTEGSWGDHYTDGSTNRYIAYVRDGKAFGGKLATETDAFSMDRTEKENAISIVKYYVERNDLLTHDIYFVRGEDVGDCIEKRAEEAKGQEEKYYVISGNTKCFYVPLTQWRLQYPLMEVSRRADKWEIKHTGKGKFDIRTAPMDITSGEYRSAAEKEKYMNEFIARRREAQKGGLTEEEVLKICGLLSCHPVWDREEDIDY